MKWRDVLIGAAFSLAVTVLGGIAVYYATKEPEYKKSEILIYSLQKIASFTGGSQDLTFASVKLSNDGGIAAKHVTILINLKTSEIRDLSISSSPGLHETTREKTVKMVRLDYEAILPNESVTLNFLLSSPENPLVSMRSDTSTGIEKKDEESSQVSFPSKINKFVKFLVPLTGIILLILSLVGFIFLQKKGYLFRFSPDKNNAGFLLLHHGLVDDAEAVLTDAVRSGYYDAPTLSNLALCKAVKGNFEQAKQLISASSFLNNPSHSKAVSLFNEALIHVAADEKTEALVDLKKALQLSPSEIRKYCQNTVYLDAVRNDPAFYALIKDDA